MPKAIGPLEIAAGTALMFVPGGQAFAPYLLTAGITTTAGEIAQALGSQNSLGITTRANASLRQIVRGTMRVAGVIIYQSTTGGHYDQYNMVIVLAGHQCWAIENLYLDGRRVYWEPGSAGQAVSSRNGYTFGGSAATSGGFDGEGSYVGPNGQHYNFGTLVYCEARFGDQPDGDVMAALTANDPNWSGVVTTPWVGGCTYVYLKVEYDQAMFPQFPEIRFTMHGKCDVLDPRTGLRSFTTNPALHAADILSDPAWGLGDPNVNEDQLIAAANVCDEQLTCGPDQTLTESRYSCGWAYDAGVGPGEALETALQAMGGRVTLQGGQWFLWPAYWQGPSFTWQASALLESPQWSPQRDPAQLCNRVRGTYIAPQYPYNVAGDLYDSNGWFDGTIENNFPFTYRPQDFPEYAQDPEHGYATDAWLNEDSGALAVYDSGTAYAAGAVVQSGAQIFRATAAVSAGVAPPSTSVLYSPATAYTTGQSVNWLGSIYTALAGSTGAQPDTSPSDWTLSPWIPWSRQLPLDVAFRAVLSISQAQRLAKILLLRNRFQGTGSVKAKFPTFEQAGIDTGYLNFSLWGWTNKLVELADEPTLLMEDQSDSAGRTVPMLALRWPVQETDPSIYEWDGATEELTVYNVPSTLDGAPYIPVPPTDMTLDSGANTAVMGADGVVTPRVLVSWTDPEDAAVTMILIQFRPTGSGNPWQSAGSVPVGVGEAFVAGVVAGSAYDFRICSQRASGPMSSWLEADDYTVSETLSSVLSTGLNPNSPYNLNNDAVLSSVVNSGAAEVDIYGPGGLGTAWDNFTGQGSTTYPAGSITGLAFSTLYVVVWDTVTSSYLAFTDYNDALSDDYVMVGSCTTCNSGGSSGVSGGGGGSSGGGGGGPRQAP